MKIYLHNPDSGAPIKNWWDGHNFWSLDVGEVKAFSEGAGSGLKRTYGFLQEVSPEEFELKLAKLEREEPSKLKVGPEGLTEKHPEEIEEEKKVIEKKKVEAKKLKAKLDKAKDAEPEQPHYYERPRGSLLAEVKKRGIEAKVLEDKKNYVSKDTLIQLLENDDKKN